MFSQAPLDLLNWFIFKASIMFFDYENDPLK